MTRHSIPLRCAESTPGLWTPPRLRGCLPNLSWPLWMDTEMGWTAWPSMPQASPPCSLAPAMGRYLSSKVVNVFVMAFDVLRISVMSLTGCFDWFLGESVESDQTWMRPHTPSSWRFCARNGCTPLWNILLYGDYCPTDTFNRFSVSFFNIQALILLLIYWLGKRLVMTRLLSNGKWRRQVMERRRSPSTLFLARYGQWASAMLTLEMVWKWQGTLKKLTVCKGD